MSKSSKDIRHVNIMNGIVVQCLAIMIKKETDFQTDGGKEWVIG